MQLSSDCGAVARAVAFDTRDPQFESNHGQFYLLSTALQKLYGNHENKILSMYLQFAAQCLASNSCVLVQGAF